MLKTLNSHRCPNALYNDIIKWCQHYSCSTDCGIFDVNTVIEKKETVLKKVSKRWDMSGLRPITKKLQITEQLYVEVTAFNFQQPLLSILQDKELKRSSNLVNLAEYDNINSKYTSEVQDSEWLNNARKHCDEVHGLDDN